jgi:hypothetical protein
MTPLFATGRIVDLILAITAIEAILVVAYHRRTGRGIAPAAFLGTLLSGVWLMLALRGALVGPWWGWIALCLVGSLVAHLVDLRCRWRRQRRRTAVAPTGSPAGT